MILEEAHAFFCCRLTTVSSTVLPCRKIRLIECNAQCRYPKKTPNTLYTCIRYTYSHSKDDIQGFVSLQLISLCLTPSQLLQHPIPTSLLDFLLSECSYIQILPMLADRLAGKPNEMKQKNVRASSYIIPYLLCTHTKRVVWKGKGVKQ